jgi:hypothetical protein
MGRDTRKGRGAGERATKEMIFDRKGVSLNFLFCLHVLKGFEEAT